MTSDSKMPAPLDPAVLAERFQTLATKSQAAVQLDRVRQLRHKRVDDKQQTQGRALRGWSNRVTIHRRTASRILKLLLIVPIVNDVVEDMYISFWYAYEEIA